MDMIYVVFSKKARAQASRVDWSMTHTSKYWMLNLELINWWLSGVGSFQ